MPRLSEWFDTSGWYYHWSLYKSAFKDKMSDIQRWAMGTWDLVLRLQLYIEQSWLSKKVAGALQSLPPDYKVYGYTLLSCFFFALCSLFTDLIKDMPIIEILWWRFFFTLGMTSFLNLYKDHPSPLSYPNYKMILLTAVLGTTTAMSTVFALRHLPIGEATLLLTTAPIFTVILSNVFLKERLEVLDLSALVVATIGVFFVAQPSFIFGANDQIDKTPIFYVSICVALGRGFFKAAKYVAVSCAGVDVPTSVIVMCLSCLGFLVSTTFLIVSVSVELMSDKDMKKTWIHPTLLNFTYLFMVGVTYCLQQVSVCAAMQYGQPGKTSLLKYLDVVLPFTFQFLIFQEFPNTWTIIGCVCIALSTMTVLLVKRIKPIKHVKFKDEVGVGLEMENVEVEQVPPRQTADRCP